MLHSSGDGSRVGRTFKRLYQTDEFINHSRDSIYIISYTRCRVKPISDETNLQVFLKFGFKQERMSQSANHEASLLENLVDDKIHVYPKIHVISYKDHGSIIGYVLKSLLNFTAVGGREKYGANRLPNRPEIDTVKDHVIVRNSDFRNRADSWKRVTTQSTSEASTATWLCNFNSLMSDQYNQVHASFFCKPLF